ncbi:MAG: hypothetical protein ACUVXI_01310 [bacterium]
MVGFRRRRDYSDRYYRRALVKALKERGGRATLGDAVVSTGLPGDGVELALKSLLKEYRGHLAVDERGELLYSFDPAFSKAWDRWDSVKRFLRAAVGYLWRAFVLFFKVWIMLILIVYFIIFLSMITTFVFIQISGRSGRRDGDGESDGGGWEFNLSVFMLFNWVFGISMSRDRRRPLLGGSSQRPFYQKVFAFVFGEKGPRQDPLAEEREILSFIRRNRGRLVASDLVALMGWPLERAEREAGRLMVDYGGDVEVTEEGVIVYTFDRLMPTLAEREDVKGITPKYFWEKIEQDAKFNDNAPGTNWLIGGLNGFNLLMSAVSYFSITDVFDVRSGAIRFLLSGFPFAFSLIFFLIPLVRSWVQARENRARRMRNLHRYFLRYIFENLDAPVYPQGVRRAIRGALSTEEVERKLDEVMRDYDGEIESDSSGELYYRFPRLLEEVSAVRRERAKVKGDEFEIGPVIYSSES